MEEFLKLFVPTEVNIKETSLLTLAYLGDAVHTLIIRNLVLQSGLSTPNNLHKTCTKYCSAKGQAQKLESITNLLTDSELDLIRRARNTKTHNPPKNCELEIYKKATSFETLIGYLYITKNFARLNQLGLNKL